MAHNEVKKSIGELKSEVQQTPKDTSKLEEILHDAHEGLERYTPEAIHDLTETLKREAADFEVEHPQVIALINHITTSLSNLGI